MINLASASLTEDALRWHANLNATIRDDWDLFQAALLDKFWPTFRGKDGVECENFVARIRRRVLHEGKERDNDWIIANVSASFVGNALRWYTTLEAEAQEDWKLLQKALFQQYPAPDVREEVEIPM